MESAVPARVDVRALLGPRLWRGQEQPQIRAEPTGYAVLDKVLPGGGWPIGAVSEILHARIGVGELSLALPLLARLTQADRPIAFVKPPLVPYAPRLAAAGIRLHDMLVVEPESETDALWSAELLLRAGAGAVLLWVGKCEAHALRRLQIAAEAMDGCALLLRADKFAAESTPSALRLRVWRDKGSPCADTVSAQRLGPSAGLTQCQSGISPTGVREAQDRPASAPRLASPGSDSMSLPGSQTPLRSDTVTRVCVEVLKCRGAHNSSPVVLQAAA